MSFHYNQYIDFHTHSRKQKSSHDIVEIVSVNYDDFQSFPYFTLGCHPWWTEKVLTEDELKEFRKKACNDNCLAIGEIGLDKIRGADFEVQIQVFNQLLELAQELALPVIIHCVKSYDLVLNYPGKFKMQNWCIHGFNRNSDLAEQLLAKDFYLSVNANFVEHKTAVFLKIPLDRLFLETDDDQNSIEQLYLCAAKKRGITLDQLKHQIAQNANDFFKNG